MDPLVEEAMKKAAVAWLRVEPAPAYLVWCLWIDGALYVVSGEGEQAAPGLAEAAACVVTARGDHGGRIVSWSASVTRLSPDDADWAEITTALAAKRLNLPAVDETAVRWAASAVVSRLTPVGEPVEAADHLPSESLAAPPVPTPATRVPRKPFRLHRVPGA